MNLLGCVFFGIAAVAGYVVRSSSSILDLASSNLEHGRGRGLLLRCAVGTPLRSARRQQRLCADRARPFPLLRAPDGVPTPESLL